MSSPRPKRRSGAERRSAASPFGTPALRQSWATRIDALAGLDEAVALLLERRAQQAEAPVTDKDALWIEARLEDRVAVLRFHERSHEAIRTLTLTGEAIAAVRDEILRQAAGADAAKLEEIAARFRRQYKPPIMPSSPYLQIEVLLSEMLMKARSLGWFEPSIAELRARRGARVFKEGSADAAKPPAP